MRERKTGRNGAKPVWVSAQLYLVTIFFKKNDLSYSIIASSSHLISSLPVSNLERIFLLYKNNNLQIKVVRNMSRWWIFIYKVDPTFRWKLELQMSNYLNWGNFNKCPKFQWYFVIFHWLVTLALNWLQELVQDQWLECNLKSVS